MCPEKLENNQRLISAEQVDGTLLTPFTTGCNC